MSATAFTSWKEASDHKTRCSDQSNVSAAAAQRADCGNFSGGNMPSQPARKHWATRLDAVCKAMSQLLQLISKGAARPALATWLQETKTVSAAAA